MEPSKIISDGITFDDVLLLPARSDFLPAETDTRTRLTRHITLNIPLLSAPMDTVTEASLAIALAQEGGLGVIHKNLSTESQVREVVKVKRSANGVIVDPQTLGPDAPVKSARRLMEEQNISGIPITDDGTPRGKVVGILTRRDMKFIEDPEGDVRDMMTSQNLVTGPPDTTLEQAEQILSKNKVEKLLLVDNALNLRGLITMRDIDKLQSFPDACRDTRGRLRVGAAVGVRQLDRVGELIDAEVDLLVVDSAHGHSRNVIETVRSIKKQYEIEVVAGNVATEEGAADLIDAGVDAVKVGIGPGSICTTRIVSGVGVPQITAVTSACRAAEPEGVPVISDGGIRHSGDITKAIAAGANCVMLGSLLAGLDESPGEIIIRAGRRYKTYRGMGSEGAMVQGSAERYRQEVSFGPEKFVPEGVEGRVPYRGSLSEFVFQIVGGLKAGMGYCGTQTIEELRRHGRFCRISGASLAESHPHDIAITKESPNYTVEYAEAEE
ncbi:MAG: IMP dehydrogenase [Planctomycetaceae bacterium]|nr:IMP dehydrogenase [Planctomycetaceae bacterium]